MRRLSRFFHSTALHGNPDAHQALKLPLHARQAIRDRLRRVEQEPNEILKSIF